MSSPPTERIPPQLAGFPEPICAAYDRFRKSGDPRAAQEVILGALKDFLPTSSPISTDSELNDSMRLVEDLGYDSLAIAEIVFFIEDLFQVQLDSSDLKLIQTVGDLRNFVSKKLSERTSSA